MKKLLNLISEEVTKAFVSAGYDEKYGKVTLSNRPDLCEFQCNGAMAAAKEYKCAPFMISDKVAALLESDEMFESVESVKPGFLNIKMDTAFLAKYMNDMKDDEGRYGLEKAKKPLTIVVDYGGPNVAKPLHVGHLRSAVIGESVKRIAKFMGHNVIGDVHLGDLSSQSFARESLTSFILMRAIQESTRRRHRLPYLSLRIYIRQPAASQNHMRASRKQHFLPQKSFREAGEAIRHCFHTS